MHVTERKCLQTIENYLSLGKVGSLNRRCILEGISFQCVAVIKE